MDTTRRTFLVLAVTGAVTWSTSGIGIAEDTAGDTVRLTLDVQGMH